MAYLASDKINVFPSTKRGNVQVSARLMSESSMVDIVNRLIDTEGFVITQGSTLGGASVDDTSPLAIDTNSYEFNIFGYYFKIDKIQDITSLFDNTIVNIYAKITTSAISAINNYIELMGQDVNDVYEGVVFEGKTSNQTPPTPASNNEHILWILTKNSSGWWVPLDSRVKFVYDFAIGVDGGNLDT